MAEAAPPGERNFDVGYKSVQLLKEEKLGSGSYGIVCKAKCDELTCAAKIIHAALAVPFEGQLRGGVSQRGKEHRHPAKRFEQECEFLSNIRHPNVIQYLGTFTDPATGRPVLLMELMECDLTSFLEQAQRPLPFHKQVNICHDIAMALAFLHSHNIVHRDLSGKNVLMIGDVRAKVTDFGMATLIDLGSPWQLDRQPSPTTNPGTEVYMPPEALLASAQRATGGRSGLEKIDSFSFGVITLQMLTRKFPNPGPRQTMVKNGSVLKSIPEITCRKEHIDLVDSGHKLRPIFLECLKDAPQKRPAAKELCKKLAEIKQRSLYRESMKGQDFEGETVPRSHQRGRGPGLLQRSQSFVQEAQEYRCNVEALRRVKEIEGDLNKVIDEKNKTIHEKDLELLQVNDQLKTNESLCKQRTLDLEQMRTLCKEQSNELERLKEKHVTQEELNEVVREKDRIIHEKEMELQRVNDQMKRKLRQITGAQGSQREPNTTLSEKDKTIHEKEVEVQRVKGQLKKQAKQYELELKNASDQLKKLTKQCEQQADKLKRMTNGPKIPREDFDTAIQKKDDIIRERELEMKELCEELEQTREVLRVQAHKNGTCLDDLNFTELQIPPDILEGTSKINGNSSPSKDGNSHHKLQPSQQNEAATINASGNTEAQETVTATDGEVEEWRSLGSISHLIHRRNSDVIANGNTVYIASGRSTTVEAVHAYNLHSTSQSGNLPDLPRSSKDYSLAIVDGLLTAIGGSASGASKKLYSLKCTGEGETSGHRKWSEHFPPMSIGRQWGTAVCTDEYLIVAGGCIAKNDGKIVRVLDNVEVLDIRNSRWSVAASLPEPLCLASGVVIGGDTVYIGGGMDESEKATKSMYSCSLASLVKTSRPMGKSVAGFEISMWDRFADLPADWSTCVSIGDSLLAVGGTYRPPCSDQSEPSSPIISTAMSKVFRYNPANESWDVVSFMLSARSGCFAVKPSERELVVLGGGDNGVEIYEN